MESKPRRSRSRKSEVIETPTETVEIKEHGEKIIITPKSPVNIVSERGFTVGESYYLEPDHILTEARRDGYSVFMRSPVEGYLIPEDAQRLTRSSPPVLDDSVHQQALGLVGTDGTGMAMLGRNRVTTLYSNIDQNAEYLPRPASDEDVEDYADAVMVPIVDVDDFQRVEPTVLRRSVVTMNERIFAEADKMIYAERAEMNTLLSAIKSREETYFHLVKQVEADLKSDISKLETSVGSYEEHPEWLLGDVVGHENAVNNKHKFMLARQGLEQKRRRLLKFQESCRDMHTNIEMLRELVDHFDAHIEILNGFHTERNRVLS